MLNNMHETEATGTPSHGSNTENEEQENSSERILLTAEEIKELLEWTEAKYKEFEEYMTANNLWGEKIPAPHLK